MHYIVILCYLYCFLLGSNYNDKMSDNVSIVNDHHNATLFTINNKHTDNDRELTEGKTIALIRHQIALLTVTMFTRQSLQTYYFIACLPCASTDISFCTILVIFYWHY